MRGFIDKFFNKDSLFGLGATLVAKAFIFLAFNLDSIFPLKVPFLFDVIKGAGGILLGLEGISFLFGPLIGAVGLVMLSRRQAHEKRRVLRIGYFISWYLLLNIVLGFVFLFKIK